MAESILSNSGKAPPSPATVNDGEDAVEIRQSKKRKNCPTFSLLQLNKKLIDGQSNSSFTFSFPTDELTTTTPDVTPKFGFFNSGKDTSTGLSSESGRSCQAPAKNSEGITAVEEADKI
ncbi:hypothetical protein SOVF_186330 [Spinacia oleracea]|nr:hypothetical protein SOVF_186330 [Spinacia oleracea]